MHKVTDFFSGKFVEIDNTENIAKTEKMWYNIKAIRTPVQPLRFPLLF